MDFEIQPDGSPFTSGQIPEETPIVAEENSQPFYDSENDLTVRHLFEELLPDPIRPQELCDVVGERAREMAGQFGGPDATDDWHAVLSRPDSTSSTWISWVNLLS